MSLSRRSVLSGAALAGACVTLPGGSAFAQGLFGGGNAAVDPNIRFRAVGVDMSPILDKGGGEPARLFGNVLLGQMRQLFAERTVPGDKRLPVLTARITSLYYSFYADRTVSGFAFGNNDSIEGDGIVTNGGRVLSSTHILTELPPSYSGGPFTPGVDEARGQAIAYQFAWWLRREMGL